MKTFKTSKGTDLQVMSLKGKDYMMVQQRLIWFVEENPRYDIQTDFVKLNDEEAIAKCTVSILEDTPAGVRVVRKVTDYKTENSKGFPDFVEKAATGSLGRCLSLLGFGTQFAAADLDEGVRIVDSPVAPKATASTSSTAASTTPTTTSVKTSSTSSEKETKTAVVPAMSDKPANRFARKSTGDTSL